MKKLQHPDFIQHTTSAKRRAQRKLIKLMGIRQVRKIRREGKKHPQLRRIQEPA